MTTNPDIPLRGSVKQSLAGMDLIQDDVFERLRRPPWAWGSGGRGW